MPKSTTRSPLVPTPPLTGLLLVARSQRSKAGESIPEPDDPVEVTQPGVHTEPDREPRKK